MIGGTTLPVTLSAAAACAFINLWLAMRIGAIRRAEGISIGDGGNERLTARMRAQLNFAEFVPVVLILLGLTEAARGPSIGLWVAATAFVLARIAHPIGMDGVMPARGFGIIVSLLVTAGLAIYAVVILTIGSASGASIPLPPAMG